MKTILSVRYILSIVCLFFSIISGACYNDNANCRFKTPYKETSGICDEIILHSFNEFPKGNVWLRLDSLTNGENLEFITTNASQILNVAKADFNVFADLYYTEKKKGNVCTECPTQIRIANRSCFYRFDNKAIITLKTNRELTNHQSYSENNWPEYIEISTPKNGNLNHIPGTINEHYKSNKLFSYLIINGKKYSDVVYVFDSSALNSQNKLLFEVYYSSSFGLLKYSFNNGEVWSL